MNISIILPTYNESENIKKLIPAIYEEFSSSEIIVIDDNSPDQTVEIAKNLKAKVILRHKKEGIGAALKHGYNAASHELIVSMDADGSIAVRDIHRLLYMLTNYDLVVGSKYSKGSHADGFSSNKQKVLSYLGNKIFIIAFLLPVNDVTLNFRAFTKETWKKLNLKEKVMFFY